MRFVRVPAILSLLVFLIGHSSVCVNSQSNEGAVIPVTPAGQQLARFLRSYNTGDVNVLRNFIVEYFDKSALEKRSADERASTSLATFKLTRQLKLHSIERSSDFEVEALCQSQVTEAWFSITIQVAPQPPNGIIRQAFGFASRAADAIPHGKLDETQIIKELNSYLGKLLAADMLSGALLVARNGKPIFARAYGTNDSKIPNHVETRSDLASLCKMFTSVAIAQLAQQGKLSYSDPIGKYISDYPNKQAAEKVTLHQLLTHTSGLTEYSDKKEYRPARQAGAERFKTLRDWFPFFAGDALSFQPGEKSDYCNSNFIVLGAIIEQITRQDYFDYVQQHVFKPAKMNQTMLTVKTGNSAGGGLSTVGDLLKFAVALRGHKLLNAKYTDLILAPKVKTGEGESYGYGFEICEMNGRRIVGHSGGGEVDNKLDIYLDDGYTVIALMKPHAAEYVTNKLKELITQAD